MSRRLIISCEVFVAFSFAHFQLRPGNILASRIQQSVAISPRLNPPRPFTDEQQMFQRQSNLNGNGSAERSVGRREGILNDGGEKDSWDFSL